MGSNRRMSEVVAELLPGYPCGVLTVPIWRGRWRRVNRRPASCAAETRTWRGACRSWCTPHVPRVHGNRRHRVRDRRRNEERDGDRGRASATGSDSARTPVRCSSPGGWPSWADSASPSAARSHLRRPGRGRRPGGDLRQPESRNRTVGFELGRAGRWRDRQRDAHGGRGREERGAVGGCSGRTGSDADRRAGRGDRRGVSPAEALMDLMARPSRPEWDEACSGAAWVSGRSTTRPVLEDGRRRRGAAGRRSWPTSRSAPMHGATEEEMDQAVADGVLDLFVRPYARPL